MLHIPSIQKFIGNEVAEAVSDKIGAKASVGRVDLGLFNRLVIDDILVYDMSGKEMVKSARLSVKISLSDLLVGHIRLSSVQVFSAHFTFYQASASDRPNFQFVLDLLASKDTTHHTPLDLSVGSFIMRHSSFTYDRWSETVTPHRFNPNHLKAYDISGYVQLHTLTDDSLSINVRKLSMKEQSGLELKGLTGRFCMGKTQASLKDFRLQLPQSSLSINEANAYYRKKEGKILPESFRFEGAVLPSVVSSSDIESFIPALKRMPSSVNLSVAFDGTAESVNIRNLKVSSPRLGLDIRAAGGVRDWRHHPSWWVNLQRLEATGNIFDAASQILGPSSSQVLTTLKKVGIIHLHAFAKGKIDGEVFMRGQLRSDLGVIKIGMKADKLKKFTADIDANDIDLQTLTQNEKLGNLTADIHTEGRMTPKNAIQTMSVRGKIVKLVLNHHDFNNISINGQYTPTVINGHLSVDDPNLRFVADGSYGKTRGNRSVDINAQIAHIVPSAIGLTDKWGTSAFSADIKANFTASDINDSRGFLQVRNFNMHGEKEDCHINDIHIQTGFEEGVHKLQFTSDFAHAELLGKFELSSLPQSIANIIGDKLPTIPGLKTTSRVYGNDFTLSAHIVDTKWLRPLFNIDFEAISPISVQAEVNDKENEIMLACESDAFRISDKHFNRSHVNLSTDKGVLLLKANTTLGAEKESPMTFSIDGQATDNKLDTRLSWANGKETFSGEINAIADFFTNKEGQHTAHVHVDPSRILVGEKTWNVKASDITYAKNNLQVNDFSVSHDKQHIAINGHASNLAGDTLTVDLNGIDLAYVLDLVNFHSVEFNGDASGKFAIMALFGDIEAKGRLLVNHFEFEKGRMGVLDANVAWDNSEKQININAIADDGPNAMTFIDGYVSPKRNYIDLGIRAAGTYLDFIHSFTNSFISDITGHADGAVRLAGPLNNINLTGQLVVDANAMVRPLNCRYTMEKDTLEFIPDDIIIRNARIYDRNGNVGIVNGGIHHKHLTRLSYDIDIKADNLLAYDFHDFGSDTFYGTVYGSGDVGIHGKSGELQMEINVTPRRESVFVYNVSAADAIADQQFIQWNDITNSKRNNNQDDTREEDRFDMPSETHINFSINCTPETTIKLLMDSKTNDYITFNGHGNIRATYYNKGSFNMFGTYTVDEGTYGITIQDVLKKDFNFSRGGTIIFGGNPFDANLNLQASYTVNGVSLSDLNIGNSFSNNTTRVNCLMNIGGQAKKPQVSFDLDMPTVSSDEKQMVRSVINGEDEMNQQVIYLLGIGRFYPQSNNNGIQGERQQTETSLAMQSLLSGTISSQINNVLKTVIKSNSWNFGANISTGDEGWNNAEYEGLLSGRLLNNRLLVNGQFGYRDNAATANSSFIGDFDIRYLLFPNGNLALKVYNQTNDRYFTKSSLNTQGIGLIMKKDFTNFWDLVGWRKKSAEKRKK